MYPFGPPKVYVHERVHKDPLAKARMHRLMGAIRYDAAPETVDDAALQEIARARGWGEMGAKRTGEFRLTGDPILILNCFTWPSDEELEARERRYPDLRGHYFLGASAFHLRKGREAPVSRFGVCQNEGRETVKYSSPSSRNDRYCVRPLTMSSCSPTRS